MIRSLFNRISKKFGTLGRQKRLVIYASAGIVLVAALILIFTLPNVGAAASQSGAKPTYKTAYNEEDTAEPTVSPTPIATTAPEVSVDPTLQFKDDSPDVQVLQERLMDLGYLDIDESTQHYGPATKYAVQLFQRQHGLKQDGVASVETLKLLYSNEAQYYALKEGTSGTDVDSLQRQLIALGYMGKSTGYYGEETIKAVMDFQKRNKIKVDGKTGPVTLDLIYSPKAIASESKAKEQMRTANINEMIECAKKQVGKHYILGNEGPNTFDCSGLVYYCLKTAGSSRGRYNAAGYSKVSDWKKITSMSALKKGDLIFYWNRAKTRVGHVAIYIGGGIMIDASSSHGEVMRRECMTKYWNGMFVCGRRPW